jgi:hypothetical protein
MGISDLPGMTDISGRGLYNQLIFKTKIFSLLGRSAGRSRNQSGIRWELIQ